jgi:cyclophilin family peptidyl-prolyl cis-trans isomerase
MKQSLIVLLCALCLSFTGPAMAKTQKTEKKAVTTTQTAPQVKLQTSLGDVVIQLNPEKAPVTTENFLGYVKAGQYNGTIFHRVIPGFMAQGGGFTEKWEQKSTKAAIKNEADNGLPNKRGTIAMARTSDPQSATAQFFINYADNAFLDYKSPTPQGWGYAVFGEIVQGMDVVDKMATIPTGRGGPMPTDVPQTPIVIQKASMVGK